MCRSLTKKTFALLFFTAFLLQQGWSQLNMSLLDQVQYNTSLNDVWGWADPETGTEYALVGLRNGLSIVSLEDPENATEVAFIPGPNSTWRDIKTWGNFAYVSNETSNGIAVVDLSGLPDAAPSIEWTPTITGLGTLSSCHNLFVDDSGYLYLAGTNINNGGMLIADVDTDDGVPVFVAAAPAIYSHDVFTINDHMYASEIYAGRMAIYDVANKNNIQLLGTQPTPFGFTHNIWTNAEETVAFTTDERANAPVAAYDITDFSNITELDRYQPIATLGAGVIPHNVHVWDNWLLISYYTDGGKVVDASRPTNLIEVGNFDTWLGGDGGFSGAWGLYPFLPSQTVLVSDIGNGLYVLQPNFVRACWLEGVVTDSLTGAFLPNVQVSIDSEQPNLGTTDAFGQFETGQAISGTFDVTFSLEGYKEKTLSVELENGVLVELEVELAPLGAFSITGKTIRSAGGQAIPNAQVLAVGQDFSYRGTTDANGNFSLLSVAEDTYTVYAGAWGYLHEVIDDVLLNGNTTLTIELQEGYQDDFLFDLGWTSESDGATAGLWERGEPVGTYSQGREANPESDVSDDLGDECYVTGNGGGSVGDDDVDNGTVTLISPVMDLTSYTDPILTARYWFYNDQGNTTPNDDFSIRVSNGAEEVELRNYDFSLSLWRPTGPVHLADFIELTDNMRIIFETSDDAAQGHIVEGGVDQFLIEEGAITDIEEPLAISRVEAFPNPFSRELTISYGLESSFRNGQFRLFNAYGQEVQRLDIQDPQGQLRLGQNLSNGIYWLRLEVDGQVVETKKIVKAN